MLEIAFLAIGTELLSGESREGNSATLIEILASNNLRLREVRVVGDDHHGIGQTLGQLTQSPTLVVVTGGLGPTDDDFTREVLAGLLQQPMERDQAVVEQLSAFFAARGRVVHPRNLKQADRPRGTALLANRHGTAPGLLAQLGQSWVACFPGVPREFSGMLADHLPQLLQLVGAPDQPVQSVTFRVFGIPEADLQGILGQLADYGAAEFRSLPSFPDIRIKFASKGDDAAFARLLGQIRSALDWRLYGEGDNDSLAAATLRSLQARNWTLAVAESCTGGLIGHLVTEVPGASATFLADVVTYANSAKTTLASVPAELIAVHGAVSEEVAVAMARGVRSATGADVAVATTGIAGPAGGSEAKPVGTFCLAVVWPGGDYVVRRHFPGLDRGRWKRLVASTALAEVRRLVLPYELVGETDKLIGLTADAGKPRRITA